MIQKNRISTILPVTQPPVIHIRFLSYVIPHSNVDKTAVTGGVRITKIPLTCRKIKEKRISRRLTELLLMRNIRLLFKRGSHYTSYQDQHSHRPFHKFTLFSGRLKRDHRSQCGRSSVVQRGICERNQQVQPSD